MAHKKKKKSMLIPHPKGKGKTKKQVAGAAVTTALTVSNPLVASAAAAKKFLDKREPHQKNKAAKKKAKATRKARKSRAGKGSSIGPKKKRKK